MCPSILALTGSNIVGGGFHGQSCCCSSTRRATTTPARVAWRKAPAFSASGADERVAAEALGIQYPAPTTFPSQIEWLAALRAYVRERSDLFLIIRVHPREFPNRRESATSEHARTIARELADLPPNAAVDWPSDGLSLYALAQETDVCLNAWSSVGKELALLGIPVVFHCPNLLTYPADIGIAAETREDYFVAVERALALGWSIETSRRAFRWCAIELSRSLIDIGDGFTFRETERPSLLRRIARRAGPLLPLEQLLDCWRRPRRLREAGVIDALVRAGAKTRLELEGDGAEAVPVEVEVETESLRLELSRLAAAMYAGGTGMTSLRARLEAFVSGSR